MQKVKGKYKKNLLERDTRAEKFGRKQRNLFHKRNRTIKTRLVVYHSK